ncbi:MAG: hypothetical protein AAGG44_14760 [Planctomycetota bacterium]
MFATPGLRRMFIVLRPDQMDISDDLLALEWPDSFRMVYCDGTSERLLRGEGVNVILPGDNPKGMGAFCADIPKKHSQNQTQCGRQFRFTELDRILDEDGSVLYRVL